MITTWRNSNLDKVMVLCLHRRWIYLHVDLVGSDMKPGNPTRNHP